MILLNNRQKLYKNLTQEVNFKPVSLHEILTNRDKQGIISEWRRSATSLTRPDFDEGDETRERSPTVSDTLENILCYVQNVLASTVIEKNLLTMVITSIDPVWRS
jgi:hypothetical protein